MLIAGAARAQSYAGGPLPFSIRTIGGIILRTTIRWSGDRRELAVSHESETLPHGSEADVSATTRMLVSRATAVPLVGTALSAHGEGRGYVGNRRFPLRIDHSVEGKHLRQVVTILGYDDRVFTGDVARLLFQ
ncbi:MAG: hypothetical protein KIT36_10935 [Alphaproteobacteria bacterium]|nr:hypothetical protein [Alphaproteobacteria bacterium]